MSQYKPRKFHLLIPKPKPTRQVKIAVTDVEGVLLDMVTVNVKPGSSKIAIIVLDRGKEIINANAVLTIGK